MKTVSLIFLALFISRPVFAEWVCKAYCKDSVGWLFLIERAQHPIEAFEKIIQSCAEVTRTEATLDLLFSKVDPELEAASVETSCKYEDVTKY
jgi:hypothetical protein